MDNKNEPVSMIPTAPAGKPDGTIKRVSYFIASIFGVGFIKYAPGTLGSLVALPVVWLVLTLGGLRGLILSVILIGALGHLVTALALRYTGDDEDPSFIVIDEFVAQMTVFVIPVALFTAYSFSPLTYVGAFVLFRLFDIIKPFHVGIVDRQVKGALGVILDDIIAAFYAAVCLSAAMGIYFAYTFFTSAPAVTPPM